MRPPVHLLALTLAAPLLAGTGVALADGTSLRADLVEGKSIRLDGVPKEWGGLVALSYTLRGRNAKPDLEARAGLAYDSTNLYVGADVTDDVLRGGGGDHLEVVIGFPGGATSAVLLYPGDPGKTAGFARTGDGAGVSGARVVEAPRAGGWSLEAVVPWSAFPAARQVRVGLRGAIFLHDADSGTTVKNVVGTAPSASYGALPPLNTEAEQSLHDGLLKEKSLRGAPRWNLIADVAGDPMKERVLVFDRYLVVLGSSFRKGSEYYYSDLGVDAANVIGCEVRDFAGNGQSDIVLRKRFGTAAKHREMVQVLHFGASEVPTTIFQHEVAVVTDAGAVVNEVSFVPDGPRTAIKISAGAARSFNGANYREPVETSWDPAILPWGAVSAQLYKLSGSAFARASEERQSVAAPVTSPAAAEGPGLPKAPPPPSASELMEKVYDLYKRDRGVSGRPRFDLATDVSGDGQNERVLLHDRDVVIFGKGFKGGTGYTFLTLQQFASPSDITEVTARDLSGDGKAEILVKGVVHATGPGSRWGQGPQTPGGDRVDREVLLVFQVANESIKRVFAAEIGRAIGRKRINGSVRFGGGGIELAPGNAVEWTAATYPFTQESGPVGGLEPLLLPWGGAAAVRYRWSGGAFNR